MRDLARATRVFWPAESRRRGGEQGAEVKLLGQFPDAAGEVGDVIQMAVDAQVFFHREPGGERDVGRGEIHAGQGGEAVAGDVVAQHGDLAGGGDQQAEQHGDGGGLARPVAAQQAEHSALGEGEGNIVHRQGVRVALDQVGYGDGVHGVLDRRRGWSMSRRWTPWRCIFTGRFA